MVYHLRDIKHVIRCSVHGKFCILNSSAALLRGEKWEHVEIFKHIDAKISVIGDCMQDIWVRTAVALRLMADLSKT